MLPTTRRSAVSPFDLLHREIDRALDRAWGNGGEMLAGAAAYPVDIHEDENNIIVEAELPGFKKDEIDVSMEQGVLTINAMRKPEERKTEHHLSERRFARVSRSFRLPIAVDENKVEAHLEHGLLTLTLPKREEVKPRRIEVK